MRNRAALCLVSVLIYVILPIFSQEDFFYVDYDSSAIYAEGNDLIEYYYYYDDGDDVDILNTIDNEAIDGYNDEFTEDEITMNNISEEEVDEEEVQVYASGDAWNRRDRLHLGEDEWTDASHIDDNGDDNDVDYDENEMEDTPPLQLQKHGFIKSTGGLHRISGAVATPVFLEHVSSQFGCQLKKDMGGQRVRDPAYRPPPKETTATANKSRQNKKLTPREVEQNRLKEKEEEEKSYKVRYPLGADCETLVCGACRAIVETFADAVISAINDVKFQFIYDVADGFCDRAVSSRLSPLAMHVCHAMMNEEKGYREAVVRPFEEDDNIDKLANDKTLFTKKKNVCLSIGVCSLSQYDFISEPEERNQEQWDVECFVCQAAIKDIEERSSLVRSLTDETASRIVAATCDRLGLDLEYDALCRGLISNSRIEEIAWMVKVHLEVVARKEMGAVRFADKVCGDIVYEAKGSKYCEKWIDPAELKRKAIEDSIEPVFY